MQRLLTSGREDDAEAVSVAPVIRRKPPPMVLARSLEEASLHSLVHVDGRGQVRSPARGKAIEAFGYATVAATLAGSFWLYWLIGGSIGIVGGGVVSLVVGRQILAGRRLQRAMALIAHERLDEAEVLLETVRDGRWLPRVFKALAEQGLARVATRRGRHDEALPHIEAALSLFERIPGSRAYHRGAIYSRTGTLVNLGRIAEARQAFASLASMEEGDYLRIQRWGAELFICFAEGTHDLDSAALHERTRAALAITTAAPLLGLLAWAHARAGDSDMAAHVLAAAWDRPGVHLTQQILPSLYAWMLEQPKTQAAAATETSA